MKKLIIAAIMISFISGCAIEPNRPTNAHLSAPQTVAVSNPATSGNSHPGSTGKSSFGVSIDLSKLSVQPIQDNDRRIQSGIPAFDLAISGIDDADGDGKVDRVRYTVTTAEGSKEYERKLSAVEIVLANADPTAVDMIRSGQASVPDEYIKSLNEKLRGNAEVQAVSKMEPDNYRVQLTPLALGCIWATAGVNAGVAVGCLAAGWFYWGCLVAALGMHTAIAVAGCLLL